MSTFEKQLAANRANAQKSTGPRTDKGKHRSSQNAPQHGVLAASIELAAITHEIRRQSESAAHEEDATRAPRRRPTRPRHPRLTPAPANRKNEFEQANPFRWGKQRTYRSGPHFETHFGRLESRLKAHRKPKNPMSNPFESRRRRQNLTRAIHLSMPGHATLVASSAAYAQPIRKPTPDTRL